MPAVLDLQYLVLVVVVVEFAPQAGIHLFLDLEGGLQSVVYHIFCENSLFDFLYLLFELKEPT